MDPLAPSISTQIAALGLTAVGSGSLAAHAWRRRAVPGGTALALLMLAIAWWTGGRALEAAAVDVAGKIFWAKVEYLGIASVAPLWLLFALGYSCQRQPIGPIGTALLWVVPAFTVVLAATNEEHGLIWRSVGPSGAGPHLLYVHGPWFRAAVVYNYLLMLAGLVALLRAHARMAPPFRGQTRTLVLAALLPWAGNALYITGRSPVPGLDPTPFAFALSGLVVVWSVHRFGLLDLVPVARAALVEQMTDGVLVVDPLGRIVDANPAALRLLGLPGALRPGGPAREVLAPCPEALAASLGSGDHRTRVVHRGPDGVWLDVEAIPLRGPGGRESGRLVALRDVTARHRAEEDLRQANAQLAARVAEVEALQARLYRETIRDALTGLFNRRFMEETLERELARAGREGRALSLVMLDVDDLKAVNDGLGHRAGDVALRALGALLRERTRRSDLACRLGGDEFVVIMLGVEADAARVRAEQWRAAVERLEIVHEGARIAPRISAGVAAFPDHASTPDELLRAADRAPYAAKAGGRNRVACAGPEPSLRPGASPDEGPRTALP